MRAAIRSVLAQTFRDFELVLLDDCPEDDRSAVVREFNDPRIVYTRNERNLGITPSRNRLMQMAKGEYFAVFDHDDLCYPERLALEVAYLDAHPEVGVVSGTMRYVPANEVKPNPENDAEIRLQLLDHCALWHSAAMIRRDVLEKNSICYRERYSPSEDHALWLELLPVTQFHNLQEILVDYRWHGGNTTILQAEKMAKASAAALRNAFARYPELRAEYDSLAQTISHYRLFGIPVLKTVSDTHGFKAWLFDAIPILSCRRKQRLP